ncbi:MAG: hypothetical protein PQJ60_10690 [Spirochaetales bacterium]|nr:hypothetical protein [Spirochaetales bacterium]
MTEPILEQINEYVLNNAELSVEQINIDVFQENEGDEIFSRTDPSAEVETRLMDGSRIGLYNVSYYSRSSNLETAKSALDSILSVLDLGDPTDISDIFKIKIASVSSPILVNKAENGDYIYTASVRLEYYKER